MKKFDFKGGRPDAGFPARLGFYSLLDRHTLYAEGCSPVLMAVAKTVRWWLTRIGVQIAPYYWIKEGEHPIALPPLWEESGFSFGFVDAADLERISCQHPEAFPVEHIACLSAKLQTGSRCFGARYRDQTVALMSIDLHKAEFLGNSIPLAPSEAYLGDMFTLNEFRGRNIAPHLRYRAYAALRDIERTTFYSYSDVLNVPALKFKRKLEARILWLGLYVEIFRTFRWHWRLRAYDFQTDG